MIASAVAPWASRLRISPTEMRMPRTIGFPPKMPGSLAIRSSWPICSLPLPARRLVGDPSVKQLGSSTLRCRIGGPIGPPARRFRFPVYRPTSGRAANRARTRSSNCTSVTGLRSNENVPLSAPLKANAVSSPA